MSILLRTPNINYKTRVLNYNLNDKSYYDWMPPRKSGLAPGTTEVIIVRNVIIQAHQ